MISFEKDAIRRDLRLSALGMVLQLAGSVCLLAATIGIVKNVNLQIKKAIIQELNKQVEQN